MKEGWKIQTLGDVATFINGDRSTNYPSKKDYVIDGIPFVNAGNLIQSGLDLESLNLISQSKYDSLTQGKFVEGDILFCLRGTLGKHSIVQNGLNGAIASSLVIIRTKDGFNNKYISYFLDYKQPFIDRLNNGAAQPNIPAKTMKGFPILLPPNEKQQQSIVEYFDSAFVQIDELKSNAEKQLAEARALFQSALTQAMQPKPGWQEKTIGDICEIVRGKRFVRADIVDDGVPCIHYGDIYTYYGLSATKTRGYLKPELAKKMRFAKKNDVVVVQAGENNWDIGVGVAYFGEEPAAVHDACFILKHKQDPMFISYYLRSFNYHWYLLDYVHEGKICSFLKPALEKAPIPLPPLSEQQSIVATLDSLKSKVDRLQENFITISQECDALKQAILRQIFE